MNTTKQVKVLDGRETGLFLAACVHDEALLFIYELGGAIQVSAYSLNCCTPVQGLFDSKLIKLEINGQPVLSWEQIFDVRAYPCGVPVDIILADGVFGW